MNKKVSILIFLMMFVFINFCSAENDEKQKGDLGMNKDQFFTNPIIPPPAADPWVVFHKGYYYYCASGGGKIRVTKSKTLQGLKEGVKKAVWKAPKEGEYSRDIWAPELHLINEKWYIYFAADDGDNKNHKMYAIQAKTDDPQGEYDEIPHKINTPRWAIDGTVLQFEKKIYFVWSSWMKDGSDPGHQYICIAPMKDPFTLASTGTLLAGPNLEWERKFLPLCEGPQILQNNGKVFIIYSASASWTKEYCLGLIEYTGGDITDQASWKKWDKPVFEGTDKVFGVGHCSFTKSPDQKEDWIVFHAKSKKEHGWEDRCVFIQKFTYDESGYPVFGKPISPGENIPVPSK